MGEEMSTCSEAEKPASLEGAVHLGEGEGEVLIFDLSN